MQSEKKKAISIGHPCLLGRNCYVTLAFSGLPKEWNKITSGCLTPPFSGSRTPARGTKSEVAASPLPSRGPKRGRNCYVTPAFSGVPNAKRGEQNQKWLPHPCLLWRPTTRRNCYGTPAFSRVPNAKHGEKIRSGCLTTAFLEAHKWAELACHPCILGCPQRQARGTKSEVAASPEPSWGPKRGRSCYVTPASLGLPNAKRKERIRSGYLTPAFSNAHNGAELLSLLHSRGSPNKETKSEAVASSLPSRGRRTGRNCYVIPVFSGIPNTKRREKIRSGYLNPAFSGAHKWAELLLQRSLSKPRGGGGWGVSQTRIGPGRFPGGPQGGGIATSPLHSRGPQHHARGKKPEVVASPLPSRGPKEGGIATSPLHSRGPQRQVRGENQKWQMGGFAV